MLLFLSTLYLAFTGPVVRAPAMNTNMWNHPATLANLDVLRSRGHKIVGPDSGDLACGTVGPGRLAEPEWIAEAVISALRPQDLTGETVLITAGASAPEVVVQDCINWLNSEFGATVEEVTTREEHVSFPLPRELRALQTARA